MNLPAQIDNARIPIRSGANSEIIFFASSPAFSQVIVFKILLCRGIFFVHLKLNTLIPMDDETIWIEAGLLL